MKKSGLIIALVILIIAMVPVALILKSNSAVKDNGTPSSPSPATTTTPAATTNNTPPPATAPMLIKYTNSGFNPVKVTVKPGTRITVRNDSSNPLQFNSDPHPAHTDNTELNLGSIGAGEDKTFAITKSGSWGYHNHLNPSDKGSIVVQ